MNLDNLIISLLNTMVLIYMSLYFQLQGRSLSPPTGGRHSQPGYSYLSAAETNDKVTLKRPIDPYDRKISTPGNLVIINF